MTAPCVLQPVITGADVSVSVGESTLPGKAFEMDRTMLFEVRVADNKSCAVWFCDAVRFVVSSNRELNASRQ